MRKLLVIFFVLLIPFFQKNKVDSSSGHSADTSIQSPRRYFRDGFCYRIIDDLDEFLTSESNVLWGKNRCWCVWFHTYELYDKNETNPVKAPGFEIIGYRELQGCFCELHRHRLNIIKPTDPAVFAIDDSEKNLSPAFDTLYFHIEGCPPRYQFIVLDAPFGDISIDVLYINGEKNVIFDNGVAYLNPGVFNDLINKGYKVVKAICFPLP